MRYIKTYEELEKKNMLNFYHFIRNYLTENIYNDQDEWSIVSEPGSGTIPKLLIRFNMDSKFFGRFQETFFSIEFYKIRNSNDKCRLRFDFDCRGFRERKKVINNVDFANYIMSFLISTMKKNSYSVKFHDLPKVDFYIKYDKFDDIVNDLENNKEFEVYRNISKYNL